VTRYARDIHPRIGSQHADHSPTRNLALAVLARAFIDATTDIPEWAAGDFGATALRQARAQAVTFLLSLDPDNVYVRDFWFGAAGVTQPPRARMIEALERHATNKSAAIRARLDDLHKGGTSADQTETED